MYAVVKCLECGRARIIDLSVKSSRCPYCNSKADNSDFRYFFKSEDMELTRAALNQFTGYVGGIEKKHADPNTDPFSTLEYRYEHCHSLDEKMSVLSKGLTEVFGEWTFEDLEKVETKNAEKMLKAMLVNGYVHETKYGHYKAD